MSLIPFAYSKIHKKLVDVSEVPRGLSCNCICPSCGMRLQARQGEINEHHFSHYDKAEIACLYSYWVSIKDMAKQILGEIKHIKIQQRTSSNLQCIPYKIGSHLIEMFPSKKNKHHGFDLVLQTSIGQLNIYFLTPEENRHSQQYNGKYFAKRLLLEINLSNIPRESYISKKKQLEKFIVEDLKSKQLVYPSFSFFSNTLDNDDENEKIKNDMNTQDRRNSSTTEEIVKHLLLDIRSLTYRQKNTINKMKDFYTSCSQKHIEALFPFEYTICYEKDEFQYISYENQFYALADVDGLYVVYQFNKNFFVKLFSTRNHSMVCELLKKEHNEASLNFL